MKDAIETGPADISARDKTSDRKETKVEDEPEQADPSPLSVVRRVLGMSPSSTTNHAIAPIQRQKTEDSVRCCQSKCTKTLVKYIGSLIVTMTTSGFCAYMLATKTSAENQQYLAILTAMTAVWIPTPTTGL